MILDKTIFNILFRKDIVVVRRVSGRNGYKYSLYSSQPFYDLVPHGLDTGESANHRKVVYPMSPTRLVGHNGLL